MCKSMDYEKAYKEALERAKKLKAGFEGYNANVAIIEQIFPGLSESESEDTLDEFTNNIRALITDKLTSKTKSPDGSEMSSSVFIDDKTAKDIANGILFYVGKEAVKNPNREIPEWSDEDVKMLRDVYESLYAYQCGLRGDKKPDTELLGQVEKEKQWVKVLPERLNLQSKNEWSEEDDALLKEIVSFFRDGTVKLQHDLDLYVLFLEKKFKSFRPSWKPSEEQMEALRIAYEIGTANESWAMSVLKSLYNDLKKL